MGLDQFAYRVKKGFIKKPVDFQTEKYNEETQEHEVLTDKKELHYWRKHPHLQGWMSDLYYEKGGESSEFNCVNVQLTWEDLETLEEDIKTGKLPDTCGFFFGDDSSEEYKEEDLGFVEEALIAIRKGYDVYYSSWW
jgi:hypothetical protein|tara:strand:- start:5623 stop:6033 length:411 start_codon:yes stop_codon:yes gene_type:complete